MTVRPTSVSALYPPAHSKRTAAPRQHVAASPAVAGFRPASAALAIAAAFAGLGAAQAQPVGLQAVHGAATIATQGNQTLITTQNGAGSSHSALNWQSFSVPAGTLTRFNQPNAQSTSINRVLGNNPSAIFGTLSSNGRLVLVNPSGIAVGAGAVVDTAGFTASTLRMTDADALAGRLVFGDGGLAGPLSVGGQIVARSGDIVLIAPQIETAASALIQSPNGATVLAAGQKVAVTGRGLEGIRLEVQAPNDSAVNLGTLQGDAVGLFAGTLRHSGLINATAASADGGKVVLKGGQEADIAGQVTAQRGTLGGQIHATASKVMLRSGALLDASGAQGGGEVLVGGGWQGQDARLTNALNTTAEAGSTVRADATVQGDGGTVVLWSDQTTRTGATLSARGGVAGGNGGQIETSGKGLLDVTRAAEVQARASTGKAGEWLLDPFEIVIASVGGPAVSPTFPGTYGGENSSQSSYIAPSIIETALNAGGNVTIKTTGPATAPAPNESAIRVSENITKSAGAAATLKLVAHGNIQVDSGISIKSTSGPLNLDFTTGYSADSSTVSSTGGSLTLSSSATLNSNGGTITLTGNGGAAGNGLDITDAVVNAGAGNVSITGKSDSGVGVQFGKFLGTPVITGGNVSINGGSTTGAQGVFIDRATVNASAGLTVESTNNRVRLSGATLNATGGNLLVSAKGISSGSVGSGTAISLAVVDSSATPSIINNTGGGTVVLQGEFTNHASSFGSPSALLVANSTITSNSGAMTLSGITGAGSYVEDTVGVLLSTGASVGSASGNISLTGTAGSTAHVSSRGLEIINGATVNSGSGNVTLAGTLNNPSAIAGRGLVVGGKVTGAQVTLTGVASVGSSSGTALDVGSTAIIQAGAAGLTATGSTSSATTATNLVGVSYAGAVNSTGLVQITGAISAPSASGATGLSMSGGTVSSGGAGINLTGSGTPAPAPASAYEVSLNGTTVSSAGGEIRISGDRINIASPVNSAAGRTSFLPFTTSRAITLGGASETAALNLSSSELNQVTASVIVVGSGTSTGGIDIGGTGGAINPTGTNSLSLINNGTTGGISQSAALTVAKLNADARTVNLTNASNLVDEISGRSYATGNFQLTNGKAAPLTVGTVDGINGIDSGIGAMVLTQPNGSIVQTQPIVAATFTSTSRGGITLTNAGNQIGGFSVTNNGGNIVIKNGVATTLISVVNNDLLGPPAVAAGRTEIDNTGNITLASGGVSSASTATGLTLTSAGIGIKSSGAISASGASPHITAGSGGSVYLFGAGGAVGASTAARVGINTTGPVQVDVGVGQANLSLTAITAQLKAVSAPGTVDIAGTGANAITITDASSSADMVNISNVGSLVVDGIVSAASHVIIDASNSITVQPAAANAADAQINAGATAKLNVSTAGSINVLASANRGARVTGVSGGAAGCATQAVCITTAGGGVVNVTANGNNSAAISSAAGNIGINSGSLVLSSASAGSGDALVKAGGTIDSLPATCTNCNLLPFGVDPLANAAGQNGLLAVNYYSDKVVAGPDSSSLGASGGSINLLANDYVNSASGTLTSAPATPALVTVTLTSPPSGVTLIGGGTSIQVDPTMAGGTYNLNYTSCVTANPTQCATGTVSFTKAPAAPAPAPPAPTPPAPTPPAPTPPAPTPPAPTPPAPTPPAPTPPAPTPPAPTPPAPAPAASPSVEQVVALLRNEETRQVVLDAVREQDNTVTTFVKLLIKEEATQSEADKKKDKDKDGAITLTGDQCRSS